VKRILRLLFLHLLAAFTRPFARPPAARIARVLYIKPDHLGDVLLATPVLAALRRRLPAARITAIVGPWSEVVLRRNPDIDALLTCPFPSFTRPRMEDGGWRMEDRRFRSSILYPLSSILKPYLALLRYGMLLRAGRYDLAIVGRDDHWWGAALALLAGAPRRIGFAVPECRPFLTTALPWHPRTHVTAQGLALIEALNGLPPSPTDAAEKAFPTRFDPAYEDVGWAEGWLRSRGVAAGERLVVLHPGTGGPAKLWFAERWAEVADQLAAPGVWLALTGGPGEEALAADVAARMRERPLVLAGQTTVGQLAALLRRAALVLGVDSGPLHLAAAQGAPTIHLYGPGDAARFGPWGDPAQHAVIHVELWCSPCGVFDACPRGLARPECMERIDVARVLAQARRLLDDGSDLP
jgi:ADP-heptose:LPS heptosyltransferase